MKYKEIRDQIEKMVKENPKDFTKAIIGMEKDIDNEESLERIYDKYMDNDSMNLLNEEFDCIIEEIMDRGEK